MKLFKLLFIYLLHSYLFAQSNVNFIDNNIVKALEKSQIENKLIFIDFYTTWCAPCKRMDKEVFTDYTIQTFFNENFINLKINAETELGKKICPKYQVEAFPTFVFIDSEEKMIYKIVGYQKIDELLNHAKKAISEFEKGESIEIWEQKYLSNKKNKDFLKKYIEKLNSLNKEVLEPFNDYYKLLSQEELVDKQNISFFIRNPYLHKNLDKFRFLIIKYKEINNDQSSYYFPGSFHDTLYESLLSYFNQIVESKDETQLNKFEELLTIFPKEKEAKPWFELNDFSYWKAKYYLNTNNIIDYLNTIKSYEKDLLNIDIQELKLLDSLNLDRTNKYIEKSTFFKSQESKNQIIKMNNDFLKNHLSNNFYEELIEIAKNIIYYDDDKNQIRYAISLLKKAREIKILAFNFYLEAIGEYKLNNIKKAKQTIELAKKKAGEPNLLKLIDDTSVIIHEKLPFQKIQKI